MSNEQRTVHFADAVEVVMSNDDETSNSEQHSDRNEYAISTNRNAWSPSEAAFFSQHQYSLKKLDLAPRQPQRSLDSILDDAISTCEALITMSPCNDHPLTRSLPPPQIPARHVRLDRSLFSIRPDASFPPPPPLSGTSCIVSHVLNEIIQ
eukprot:CAMPEP_0116141516 /NCGR_PEP_ID=MMETSP0329-20121206/14423_1 /TAXON_ID=697910 /ORGANISM="Pseudo-nitzschia arenysensis, Strain B593" /LENGTH=150 /DNA_ID=CAMNT_0003636703 /DNA_START=38 /DNA_END=490 /DNA_ORIENTATION=-